MRAALVYEKYLLALPDTPDEESDNIRQFFELWKSGALNEFPDYGLVLERGHPVLLVRLEEPTLRKVDMEVSKHFKYPALFLPCKTARWDDSTVDDEFDEDTEFKQILEDVSVILGAVVDERGDQIARGRPFTAYALASSLEDFEERIMVLPLH